MDEIIEIVSIALCVFTISFFISVTKAYSTPLLPDTIQVTVERKHSPIMVISYHSHLD